MVNINKQLFKIAGVVLVGAYLERFLRPNSDRAIYCPSNLNDPRSPLAKHIENILNVRPSLRHPNYQPPFWVFNSWVNIIIFVIKQKWSAYWDQYNQLLKREYIPTDDGSRLSIDLLSDADATLPKNSPLLLILPTITGSGKSHTYLMKMALQRGWRPLCLNRRGLADVLDTPRFNIMGDQKDTAIQVEYVRSKYKESKFVGMMGLSAGSGLLVNYLGSSGENCGVNAACCLCPAYDIEKAFVNLYQRYPNIDKTLLSEVKKKYILANVSVLQKYNSNAVDICKRAKSLNSFIHAHVPFTGSPTLEDYMIRSNPMNHVFGIRCPVMILNSEDDMICLPENIRDDLAQDHGGVLLLRTSEGSHIAFCEGWNGAGNYLVRTSLDFLDGAMEVKAKVEEF